jgi:acyl-CoA dehydrogenase
MAYESQLAVVNDGGEIAASNNGISFVGCDSLTIILAAGTDYVLDYKKGFHGEAPHACLATQLKNAAGKSYQALWDEHLRDYRSIFGRVELTLGETPAAYGPEALWREMLDQLYPLQYHLYLLALHRLLRLRLPDYDYERDVGGVRVTREAAMAKMHATESAQQVIDAAVQLFGGLGVVSGHPVERLYREVRALRIYEGATEVQKIVIAREVLKNRPAKPALAAE